MRVRYVAIGLLIAGLLAGCGEDDLRQNSQAGAGVLTTPTLPPAPLSSSAALIALSLEDGRELWRAPAPHEWTLTPFLTDKTIYAYASDDGALVAIDLATHEQRWILQADGAGWLPVPIDGMVFVRMRRSLVAVDEMTGVERWSVAEVTPRAANAEMVYAHGPQGGIVALDVETGVERWRTDVSASTGMLAGDTLYLSVWGIRGASDSIRAFDAKTGEQRWSHEFPSPDIAGIAGGNVYVLSTDVTSTPERTHLVALNAETGAERWRVDGAFWPAIWKGTVAGDGTIVTYLADDRLVALDAMSGETRWEVEQDRGDVVAIDASIVLVVRFDEHPRDDHLDPRMIVRAFDAESGEQRWERSIEDFGGLPAGYSAIVAGDDRFYVVKP